MEGFYAEISKMDTTLRFGDIIKEFPICFPVISNPSSLEPFDIRITPPGFSVVLSPCCSISEKVLSVAPLLKLPSKIFSNPFLAEDPKRINRMIEAENSLPPQAWESMEASEKAQRLAKGKGYVFVDNFVYEESNLFEEYTINRKEGNLKTRHYMIDFRITIHVICDKIINPGYKPGPLKCLQLKIETRKCLREKIASFYKRVPQEDIEITA